MTTTVDNKLNMSLDDIIKKERKSRQQKKGGKQGFGAKKRVVAMKRNIRGNRSSASIVARKDRLKTNDSLSAATAMRVVNKLVKRAIQRRANQSLINRAAALRRRAVRRSFTVPRAVRGLRARGVSQRLAGRLSGVSQRSLVIGGARRSRKQAVVFAVPQVVRGRGVSRMGQLVSDNEAVVVGQREIARPVVRQRQLVRRAGSVLQPRRQIILQRRKRPFIIDSRPVVFQRGGISKRVVYNEEPQVVVVRDVPRRQTQIQAKPVFQQIQRRNVQSRNRIVRAGHMEELVINPNAAQMREALGIGVRRSEPQRFEPSSTFLQRIPVANRRGRGFEDIVYG